MEQSDTEDMRISRKICEYEEVEAESRVAGIRVFRGLMQTDRFIGFNGLFLGGWLKMIYKQYILM